MKELRYDNQVTSLTFSNFRQLQIFLCVDFLELRKSTHLSVSVAWIMAGYLVEIQIYILVSKSKFQYGCIDTSNSKICSLVVILSQN